MYQDFPAKPTVFTLNHSSGLKALKAHYVSPEQRQQPTFWIKTAINLPFSFHYFGLYPVGIQGSNLSIFINKALITSDFG